MLSNISKASSFSIILSKERISIDLVIGASFEVSSTPFSSYNDVDISEIHLKNLSLFDSFLAV